MRTFFGWLLITSPLTTITVAMVMCEGVVFALCLWGAVAAIAAVVALGAWMVFG